MPGPAGELVRVVRAATSLVVPQLRPVRCHAWRFYSRLGNAAASTKRRTNQRGSCHGRSIALSRAGRRLQGRRRQCTGGAHRGSGNLPCAVTRQPLRLRLSAPDSEIADTPAPGSAQTDEVTHVRTGDSEPSAARSHGGVPAPSGEARVRGRQRGGPGGQNTAPREGRDSGPRGPAGPSAGDERHSKKRPSLLRGRKSKEQSHPHLRGKSYRNSGTALETPTQPPRSLRAAKTVVDAKRRSNAEKTPRAAATYGASDTEGAGSGQQPPRIHRRSRRRPRETADHAPNAPHRSHRRTANGRLP